MSAAATGRTKVDERVALALLVLASAALTAALCFGVLWRRAESREVSVADLTPDQRRELGESLLQANPGIFEWSYYEPRIGYTLRRESPIEAWGDTFTSNALGFRSGPPEKKAGTLRVLFVGDSWTYGMGIKEAETFPEAFEALANAHAGLDRPVEAWTLALPGYNTFNYLSALWLHYQRLQPDAVVIVPSSNDNQSTRSILPNGSHWASGLLNDQFGERHSVTYHLPRLLSYRFTQRWQMVLQALRRSEERLRHLGMPVGFLWIARWQGYQVHHWVTYGGLEAPYLVVPVRYASGSWLNPQPIGHGTPAANALYGRLAYRLVADMLGWPELPAMPEDPDTPVFRTPPAGEWAAVYEKRVMAETGRAIPESFERGSPSARLQVAGPLNPQTGRMGRATTVLVRRRAGARQLAITVEGIAGTPSLYPLRLWITVPSAGGGVQAETQVPAKGTHTVRVDIPPDVSPGVALDVTLEAESLTIVDRWGAVSLILHSVDQV